MNASNVTVRIRRTLEHFHFNCKCKMDFYRLLEEQKDVCVISTAIHVTNCTVMIVCLTAVSLAFTRLGITLRQCNYKTPYKNETQYNTK